MGGWVDGRVGGRMSGRCKLEVGGRGELNSTCTDMTIDRSP